MNEIIVTTDDLFNISQAADKLHVTRMTVYRWLASGKLISIKLGGMPFIPKSEIDRLLRTGSGEEEVAKVAPIGVDDADTNNR